MLRKVSMVMIDVVLGPAGVGVQALVSQLMLSLMFFATLQYRPLRAPHIGRLELFSLSVSFMTLWMGSFFWASPDTDEFSMVNSVLIVIINVIFVVVLCVVLVGDACHDYEVVKKVKVSARKTWLRASSLRGSSMNGDEEGEEGRDGDWSLERFGGGNNGKSGGGNTIEMENPMEAARKRGGNKRNAKVQNQGEITKKKKEKKKQKKKKQEKNERQH